MTSTIDGRRADAPRSARAARVAGVIGVACLASITLGSVAFADTMVAVVRVADDADDELRTRVEGQTVDLDVELVVSRTGAVEAALGRQLATARGLAAQHDARVVVWFRRDGAELIVNVAEPGADRVLVRRIAPDTRGDRAVAASAVAEAAAVVVRSALRALADGGAIGVSTPEVAPAPEPAPVPDVRISDALVTPPRGDGDDSDDDEPATWAPRPLRPVAALAWTAVMDGGKVSGHHGIAARVGAAGGPWRVAISAATRPAVTHTDELSTIEVGRTDLGMVLALDLVGAAAATSRLRPRTRVTAEISFGAARWARSTVTTMPTLSPTAPTATWSPVATPAIRLGRRVAAGTWIELAVGVDLVARPPEFGTATGNTFVVQTRLWPAEPHIALALAVDMF